MNKIFQDAWRKLHGIEGEYVDNENDSGGATRYGVTEAVARAAGYNGPMSELPLWKAEQIAKKKYWDVLRLDDVAQIAGAAIAYELFDSGYHVGPERAAEWLQRWLNALNLEEKLYPDLAVDGRLGSMTLRALNRYCAYRGGEGVSVLLRSLNCSQGAFYLELVERRSKDETFLYGWMRARVT